MQVVWNGLTCAVAAQVATLTTTAGRTDPKPGTMTLAAGGIVINLSANIGDMFQATATSGQRYTVTIQRESE